MEVVALVSGGKDSCFSMMRCLDYGHKVVALANLIPLDDAVDELDSYMYQTVGHQIVVCYAKCMGLPLFRRRISGSTRQAICPQLFLFPECCGSIRMNLMWLRSIGRCCLQGSCA